MKLLKNFGAILISDITSGVIGSIFWLYLATIITKSSYGELQFLLGVAGLTVGFVVVANSNVMIVYEVKQRDLRRTLFLISFLVGIITSVVLFVIYSRFDIILLTFGMMIEEMSLAYFLGKKYFAKYAIFLILQKILMIILGLSFYFVFGTDGILYGIGLSYIPLAIIVYKGFKESKFNFSLLKENIGFIINNYGSRLLVFSRRNLDKIIIVPILGFETLGEYALAFQLYLVMMMFTSISSKFLLLNDAAKINSKKFKVAVFSISAIIALLGITVAPIAIPMLFPSYNGTIEIIPIFSLTVIPNTVVIIYSSKFLGDEKSRFPLVGGIINALVYLILIALLGPIYGLVGLSLSFLISSSVYATFLIIMRRMQIH